jgi:hypothetical protein
MIALLFWLAVQEPTLESTLARARAYVAAFQQQVSGVVSEEAYEQQVRNMRGFSQTTGTSPVIRRALKSDLLLVKPQGSDRWLQFRDVFEVDGKPVRNRGERLIDLFVNPSSSTQSHAQRIVEESARYNVGPIARNINVPTLALTVLLPDNQTRFEFHRSTKAAPGLMHAPLNGAWVVDFRETRANTLIHGADNSDMPSKGRVWIDPETGRVLMTELSIDSASLRATIDVLYGEGPIADLLMPIEMRELYEQFGVASRIEGTATYGRFRQFQVSVDEQLAPVKK